jgi:hypothetical protein
MNWQMLLLTHFTLPCIVSLVATFKCNERLACCNTQLNGCQTASWMKQQRQHFSTVVFGHETGDAHAYIHVAIQALAPMPRQELCSGGCVIYTWLLNLKSSGSAGKALKQPQQVAYQLDS